MQARLTHPAMIVSGAMPALQALGKSVHDNTLPPATHELVHLRASQINGCSVCVTMHSAALRKLGESEERVFSVSAWREAPWFTPAERAALALAESMTRLSDQADPVPDAIWNEAATHYDEAALATLVVSIAMINMWNRLNATTRQIAGQWAA